MRGPLGHGAGQTSPRGDPFSYRIAGGLTATAGPVTLQLGGVLDRRVFSTDRLPLGDATYRMSNVYAPCGSARLTVDGAAVAGDIVVDRDAEPVSSTAFLAVAEVWTLDG
jgi:hypothetical protein